MCVLSTVIDTWTDRQKPWQSSPGFTFYPHANQLTSEELEALRDLIKTAKKFDEVTGQPECESDDKVATLKSILITYLSFLNENDDEADVKDTAEELIEEIAEELGIALHPL